MKIKINFKKLFIILGADLLIAACIVGLFAYDALLAPKQAAPITLMPTLTKEFGLPDMTPPASTPNTEEGPTSEPSPTPVPSEVYEEKYSATGLSVLGYELLTQKNYENSPYQRTVTQIADDVGSGARFIIYKVEIPESDGEKITYYVVDLFVNQVSDILTNVAVNEDGELSKSDVAKQAEDVGAKLAITGDYFRNSKIGYIVRNGMLYRDVSSKNDYCILKTDGELICVDGKTFESKKSIYTENVWQCWAFGPSLLTSKGSVISNVGYFNLNGGRYHSIDILDNGIQNKHPRSAIGYIDDGHYLLVLVDGRSDGYSTGASLTELSQIMYDEGCRRAYNLDGGRSAVLWYNGEVINTPYKDGREISDIIYIKKGSDLNG